MSGPKYELVPLPLSEANAFVKQHHRHHRPVVGHRFSIGLSDGESIVGVAIVGRPVARNWAHDFTSEVTRLCVLDGHQNACSKLYAACWRAWRAMGGKQLITYTLKSESGHSVKASGWRVLHETAGGSWSCKSRPRVDKHPLQAKLCWGAA